MDIFNKAKLAKLTQLNAQLSKENQDLLRHLSALTQSIQPLVEANKTLVSKQQQIVQTLDEAMTQGSTIQLFTDRLIKILND